MKRNRILAFVLTAAIIVTMLFGSTAACAEGSCFALNAADNGDGTVTVEFRAASALTAVCGFQITVTAPEGFTYQSHSINGFTDISNKDKLMFQGQNTEDGLDVAAGTALITMVFAAPEGAQGEYEFSALIVDAYDADYNDLDKGETKTATVNLGYKLLVEDFTQAKASTSIEADKLYLGEVTFTITSENDQPVVAALKGADGTYTRLACTTEGGVHSFTVTVSEDTTVAIVFKGDVNLDAKIESRDGNMASRYSVHRFNIDQPIGLIAADIDGNGIVESRDGNMISRSVVEKYTIQW